MAFVNERITEEDRKQYGLDEVWEKYRDDKSIDISSVNPFGNAYETFYVRRA